MPRKPLSPCPKHPSILLDVGDKCPECCVIRKRYDKYRGSPTVRGYGYKWQKLRNWYIHEYPLCVECMIHGRTTAAQVVDHIVPHKGNERLLYDVNNLQSLCKQCHDRKTATEDNPDW